MLIGIDPLLTADLLHALAAMGHGDTIALVDANYPATRARRTLDLAGADVVQALRAVLSLCCRSTASSPNRLASCRSSATRARRRRCSTR